MAGGVVLLAQSAPTQPPKPRKTFLTFTDGNSAECGGFSGYLSFARDWKVMLNYFDMAPSARLGMVYLSEYQSFRLDAFTAAEQADIDSRSSEKGSFFSLIGKARVDQHYLRKGGGIRVDGKRDDPIWFILSGGPIPRCEGPDRQSYGLFASDGIVAFTTEQASEATKAGGPAKK